MTWVPRRSETELPEAPLSLPRAIWQVLYSRGISTESEVQNFLYPRLKDLSHPFSLDQMDVAVERTVRALRDGETVGIYGDYDLDGTPGIALLHSGLQAMGFQNLRVKQPLRLSEGYGVHKNHVDELHVQGVTLMITVDVGITDVDAIQHAQNLGIDVIVTDHHLPKQVLPPALAIVNPNKGICGSGLGHLAGTGVAFYFLLALKMGLQKEGLLQSEFNPKDLLDLFALATITDMVPLIRENRTLVKHGLHQLENSRRPGLSVLLKQLGLAGRQLSSTDISFKLAPKLNALSRLEEDVLPLHVLLADEGEAHKIVQRVLSINERRREFQKLAEQSVLEQLSGCWSEDQTHILVFSDKFHPGVVSVVANHIMEKFNRPTFLGAIRPDGRIVGSARSPWSHLNLQDVLGAVAPDLERFGGHAMAAGFEVHAGHEQKLAENLTSYFADVGSDLHSGLKGDGGELFYDAEVRLSDVNEAFMKWHHMLEPFGVGFEAPKYLARGVRVRDSKALKNGHRRFALSETPTSFKIQAPWFSARANFEPGDQVDVIFEPQWNYWEGRKTLQLMVSDMRLFDAPS